MNIQYYRAWFADYCRSFYADDPEYQRNILLKEEHTDRVRTDAALIAEAIGLSERDRQLAELAGLFHDLGRFPQYREYRTFRDSDSVNHAALGAKVLVEQNVFGDLPKEDRESLVRTVALHNVFAIPPTADDQTLLLLRIVRDADKLDIWRVFIDYFMTAPSERPSAAGLGLPDEPAVSQSVLVHLKRREMVHLDGLRTLNDFKLLQLAWIYDLNFIPSLDLLRRRDIINRLTATLPFSNEVKDALAEVRAYVDERLAETA